IQIAEGRRYKLAAPATGAIFCTAGAAEGWNMAIFEDREKGFEQKFKHDQELDFKVRVRANKLLGLWVAGLLGLPPEEAETYAKTVVEADLQRPGDDDVVEKVLADCAARKVEMTEHRLRNHMREVLLTAREQIKSERS